jgi:hypothetical protein
MLSKNAFSFKKKKKKKKKHQESLVQPEKLKAP